MKFPLVNFIYLVAKELTESFPASGPPGSGEW